MIELKNVRKYYKRKLVLSSINLTINKGEIVGVLGKNGCGKTTLLKCIMGLTQIQEGEVLIEGKKPQDVYEKLSFITEEGSYFPNMTVDEYGQFLQLFYEKFDCERYRRLIDYFTLSRGSKIKNFSKGEKSKLEVAAGFSKGADYIVMDEPFLGKDMFTRKDFLKLMATQLKETETVIIATHQINEIEHFIDRGVLLNKGNIVKDIQMEELHNIGKDLPQFIQEVTGYDKDKYKRVFKV
ncbi:ABC-2 type transport system ATP-binding protein [Natranaerovirga hydrolytica]|uniref:ABC-2 type transport system ATP-binding protein n=1 Tax=Natranaerovirga hydrolytica TaxID=680378 RepID=A0A4R1N9D3_9FIRM|nr:ABC transporter ATP-binding protein [Natranaerovirga hydrolytica]TCK99714.1 ABC-2 type transport system ATP-binding protein [Natranaerovirga hydrolytica]